MSDTKARTGERSDDLGERLGDWWNRATDTVRDKTEYIVAKVSRDESED